MNKRWVLLGVLFFWSTLGSSQNLKGLDTLKTSELIDTLFIDHNINNWSLRLFANYKEQRFRLSNATQNLYLVPNNPYGLGFGVATRKLILDIAFNIKGQNEDPTKRFDLQATFIVKKHLFDVFFQTYQGFKVKNDFNDLEYFRNDLKSLSSGINYMYMFNADEFSLGALKSGLSRQKKTAITFGLGGFLITNNQSAESSIVPPELQSLFNDEARLNKFMGIGAGVLGGFTALFVLPANFFAVMNFTPGIGLMYKEVETEDVKFKPSNPLVFKMNLFGVVGYNGNRFYINLAGGSGIYSTDLNFGNTSSFILTNAKLSIGYKLGK